MTDRKYYSIRRLSPYQGTVQIVEHPGFRAISPDGVSWRVQFLNRKTRLSSYGIWRADGSGNLIETIHTRPIIDALREQPDLPFAMADRLELWLLDAHSQLPLALLTATLPMRSPPSGLPPRWLAGLTGDKSFVAPSLKPDWPGISYVAHRDLLDRCVRKAAGALPRAQWFLRDAEGNGTGLTGYRIEAVLLARELERRSFPELLIMADWEDPTVHGLVQDYHDWHAPNLLTHTNLSRDTRDRLERSACLQTQKLYAVRHLLPDVINQDLIEVALVEAVMRQTA